MIYCLKSVSSRFSFSLVSRVQTTLRGSADDIGWLTKDPSLPPVVDKTERFLQILGRIRFVVICPPFNVADGS